MGENGDGFRAWVCEGAGLWPALTGSGRREKIHKKVRGAGFVQRLQGFPRKIQGQSGAAVFGFFKEGAAVYERV